MDSPDTNLKPRHWSGLGAGLAVIAVGVIFLLRNLGFELPFTPFRNWWALFILIGAIPSLTHAAERFRASGHVDAGVLRALLPAVAIIMVAVFFLLDLNWGRWWPLFVIYGGLWIMVGKDRGRDKPAAS